MIKNWGGTEDKLKVFRWIGDVINLGNRSWREMLGRKWKISLLALVNVNRSEASQWKQGVLRERCFMLMLSWGWSDESRGAA